MKLFFFECSWKHMTEFKTFDKSSIHNAERYIGMTYEGLRFSPSAYFRIKLVNFVVPSPENVLGLTREKSDTDMSRFGIVSKPLFALMRSSVVNTNYPWCFIHNEALWIVDFTQQFVTVSAKVDDSVRRSALILHTSVATYSTTRTGWIQTQKYEPSFMDPAGQFISRRRQRSWPMLHFPPAELPVLQIDRVVLKRDTFETGLRSDRSDAPEHSENRIQLYFISLSIITATAEYIQLSIHNAAAGPGHRRRDRPTHVTPFPVKWGKTTADVYLFRNLKMH